MGLAVLLTIGVYKFHDDFRFTYGNKLTYSEKENQIRILPIQPAINKDEEQIHFKHSQEGKSTMDTRHLTKVGFGYEQHQIMVDKAVKPRETKSVEIEKINKIIRDHEKNDNILKKKPGIKSAVPNKMKKIINRDVNGNLKKLKKPSKKMLKAPRLFNEHNIKILSSSQHNSRQKAVVNAFKHAWLGYKTWAWGHDELNPISKGYNTWFDLGLTIVDSLDTMLLMDLKEEFNEAGKWVKNSLRLDKDKFVNLFEVTIRVLGSLLSTYHLTGDKEFLNKAVSFHIFLIIIF